MSAGVQACRGLRAYTGPIIFGRHHLLACLLLVLIVWHAKRKKMKVRAIHVCAAAVLLVGALSLPPSLWVMSSAMTLNKYVKMVPIRCLPLLYKNNVTDLMAEDRLHKLDDDAERHDFKA